MENLSELDHKTFLRSVDRSNPETREAAERLESVLSTLAHLSEDYEHALEAKVSKQEAHANQIEKYRSALDRVRNKLEEKLDEHERDN